MKSIYLLLVVLFTAAGSSMAQTTAQDFTRNDCEGMPHNLFAELDSGYVVVLEFVMTCTPCIDGAHAVQAIIDQLPAQQQSKIYFYQFAYTNTYTCQTMIDFKNDNNLHTRVFDQGEHMCSYYGGFGMPTVAIVAGTNHGVIYSSVGFAISDTAYAGPAIRNYFAGVGVEDLSGISADQLHVYPNPANDHIQVDINFDTPESINIQITDLAGQLVREVFTGDIAAGSFKKEIDVQTIASGYYMLKVTADNKTTNRKIRISH